MATYNAEVLSPPTVMEALKDPEGAEFANVGPVGTTLVYAPALTCYGRGACSIGLARASAAGVLLLGDASFAPGASSASSGSVEFSGIGESLLGQACVSPDEVVCAGLGSATLAQALISGAGAYVGDADALLGGARVAAGAAVLDGEGAVDAGAPVILPKGTPGRAVLTARPTALVVAWAVPR